MKRKFFICLTIITVLITITNICNKVNAANLDQIDRFVVTVDPRMNDATLDITYSVTWRVLDSTTEGPLTWVKIGTPNNNFFNPTALTDNIKQISKFDGAYVKIVLDRPYRAGEVITFKYSIHQASLCQKKAGGYKFKFTPAWFTNANVKNLIIRWNSDQVKNSDSTGTEDNYLTWKKTNMSNGEKLTANISYSKDAFATVDFYNNRDKEMIAIIVVFLIAVFILVLINNNGSYYRHRGFYGGYYGRWGYRDRYYYYDRYNSRGGFGGGRQRRLRRWRRMRLCLCWKW